MKALKWIWAVAVIVVAGVQAEEIVVSWETNGVLVAEGMEPGSTGVVEAVSNMGETFTNAASFFDAEYVVDSNGMIQVAVPMFFQVKGTPASSIPDGMAYIPGGTFSMGDSKADGNSDELPVHSVYISGFYMSKTEITKAQWDDVYNWAVTHGYTFDNAGSGKASIHPVQTVSWYDCVKWCNARSEKEGKTPCYTVGGNVYRTGQSAPDCNWSAGGYRLPTEAEWEKAARGGLSGRRFPWGDTINHSYANYQANGSAYSYDTSSYTTWTFHPSYDDGGDPYTSPAGSFSANEYGLYDMAGNVWEWCWDWYDSGYYASSPSSNPRGPSSGSYRVGRGGGWDDDADFCRAASRGYIPSDFAVYGPGFRVVLP